MDDLFSFRRDPSIVSLVVNDFYLSSSHLHSIVSMRYLYRSIGDSYNALGVFSGDLSKMDGVLSANLYLRPFRDFNLGVSKVEG